jgi:hypothetical protein
MARISTGPAQNPWRWAYRFVSGRPLDGVRRTDGTWSRRATQSAVRGVDRYSWWSGLSGFERQVIRLVVTAGVLAIVSARLTGSTPTAIAGTFVPAWVITLYIVTMFRLLPALAIVLAIRWAVRWRLEWHVVQPLAASLRPVLGWPASEPHRKWIWVPVSTVRPPPTKVGEAWQWIKTKILEPSLDWMQSARGMTWFAKAWQWRTDKLAVAAGVRSEIAVRSLLMVDADSVTPGVLDRVEHKWFVNLLLGTLARFSSWRLRRQLSARVRIRVPVELGEVSGEVRTSVNAKAHAKLGGEWVPHWDVSGRRPHVEFTRKERPPEFVDYAAMAPRMAFTGDTELGIGLKIGNKLTSVDVDSDAPHLLMSMGSGAGKSVLMRLIAAQALRKGWCVIVLDFKQDHYWAQDLIDAGMPGLYYLRHVDKIHDALIELEEHRQWRAEYTFLNRNNKEAPMPQRTIILFEEMNITVNMLRAYWSAIKQKGDPGKSPALTAFGGLGGAGRSACMHLVAIGQYLTAQVFGGPEARENFGVRILARYSVAAWRTLVPEITPVPAKSGIRGRVQVCVAGEREETQVAYLTHEEVMEWASGGLAGVMPPSIMPFHWSVEGGVPAEALSAKSGSDLSRPLGHAQGGTDTRDTEPEAGEMRAIEPDRKTLREWMDAGLLPWDKYDTARKNRLRDTKLGIFPANEDNEYTADEMLDWVNAIAKRKGEPVSLAKGSENGSGGAKE